MARLPPHDDGRAPPPRNYMAELGARLIDNGYPIIPIIPGAKCPGKFERGEWRAYPDWSRHCIRPSKPYEVSLWSRWPGCCIGVAGGRVTGMDIDVTDEPAALEIEALAFRDLGHTPCVRIGLAPKRLLVYRTTTPFRSVKRHPLEALAEGSQFVAYATHPDTGAPYHWPVEHLADVPLDDLPAVSEAQVRAFLDKAAALVPPHLRRSTLGPDRSADHYYSGGDLRGTVEAIAAAIGVIPNDDLHYDDWIKVGMALKGAVGEDGWPMFDTWSQRSRKYDAPTTAKAWRGFRPNTIGAGTIYYFATQQGWVPDTTMILNGGVADAVAAVPVGSITLQRAQPPEEAPPAEPPAPDDTVPDDIMQQAGGLLADIVAWMTGSAIYPQPFLALAAAICAVGTAAGRRYTGPWDTRTNVYCIGIAESGSGKEHALTCLNNLFFAADLVELFAGEEIASGTAIESSVANRAVQLFQIDEFGHFMKSVLNPRATSSHRRDVLVKLTKYTGAATRLVKGTEYANKKERERIDVHEPCVCLYGTTVPAPLWEAFGLGQVDDGSMARMLYFRSPLDYPDHCNPALSAREVPPQLAAAMRRVVAGIGADNDFAFRAAKAQMLDGRNRPGLIRVDYDLEAASMAEHLATEQVALKRQHGASGFAPVWARWLEHINRLALIRAISSNPVAPQIGTVDLAWARALVGQCICTLTREAEQNMADSHNEANLKRLLGVIRKHGPMNGADLARKTQFLNRRDRLEGLAHLEESGQIIVQQQSPPPGAPGRGPGRPAFTVRAVQSHE